MDYVWRKIIEQEQKFLVKKSNDIGLLREMAAESEDVSSICQMHEVAYQHAYQALADLIAETQDLERYLYGMPTERPVAESLSKVPEAKRRAAAIVMGTIRCTTACPSDVYTKALRIQQQKLVAFMGQNAKTSEASGLEEAVMVYGEYILMPDRITAQKEEGLLSKKNLFLAGGGLAAGVALGVFKDDLLNFASDLVGG